MIYIPPEKSKTKKIIPYAIGPQLYSRLMTWCAQAGILHDKDYLFRSKNGNIMRTGTWSTIFRSKYLDPCFDNKPRIYTKDGVPLHRFTAYCGRRFFYSWMDDTLGDKISISDKATLSGHSDINTLFKFYQRKRQKNLGRDIMTSLERNF